MINGPDECTSVLEMNMIMTQLYYPLSRATFRRLFCVNREQKKFSRRDTIVLQIQTRSGEHVSN